MNGRQPGPLFASEAETGVGGGIRGEVKAGVESNVESNVGGGVEARGGVGDEACVAVAAASDSGASLIGITVRPQSTDVNHPDKSPGEEGQNRDTGTSEAAGACTAVLALLLSELFTSAAVTRTDVLWLPTEAALLGLPTSLPY